MPAGRCLGPHLRLRLLFDRREPLLRVTIVVIQVGRKIRGGAPVVLLPVLHRVLLRLVLRLHEVATMGLRCAGRARQWPSMVCAWGDEPMRRLSSRRPKAHRS